MGVLLLNCCTGAPRCCATGDGHLHRAPFRRFVQNSRRRLQRCAAGKMAHMPTFVYPYAVHNQVNTITCYNSDELHYGISLIRVLLIIKFDRVKGKIMQ